MQITKLQKLIRSPIVTEEQILDALIDFLSSYGVKDNQLAKDLLKIFGG